MKRFYRCGKAFVKEKHTLDFACYAFSLLLNATELEILSEFFKIIVIVFLSKTSSKLFLENVKKLQNLINERPLVKEEVDKILKNSHYEFEISL